MWFCFSLLDAQAHHKPKWETFTFCLRIVVTVAKSLMNRRLSEVSFQVCCVCLMCGWWRTAEWVIKLLFKWRACCIEEKLCVPNPELPRLLQSIAECADDNSTLKHLCKWKKLMRGCLHDHLLINCLNLYKITAQNCTKLKVLPVHYKFYWVYSLYSIVILIYSSKSWLIFTTDDIHHIWVNNKQNVFPIYVDPEVLIT